MPKPETLVRDTCSYELQLPRPSRRHQLLALALWLTCSAFTWPGRAAHLSYQAKHGSVAERVEALRLLEENAVAGGGDAILAALEDDASEVRAQAASSRIVAGDSRAISNLLDLASAKEPTERVAAIQALGRTGSVRAQPAIEQALQDPQPAVRVAAADALSLLALSAPRRQGAMDAGKLAPLLSADDPELRLAAVRLLAQLKAAAARSSQLRQAARDRAPEVRIAALQSMGHAQDARWLPDLQSGVADTDESVRLWAISALGDSNLPGAVSVLRARASAVDLRAAQAALAALGRIDDASVLSAIAPQLTRPLLAYSALDALVTRLRRLHHESAFRDSSEALRRAIESARAEAVLDVLAGGLVTLAQLAHAPQLAAAEHDRPATPQLAAAQHSLLQALEAGRGDVDVLTQCLIELREPALLPALIERAEHSASAAPPSLFDALIATLRASPDAGALLASHAAALKQLLQRTAAMTPAAVQLQDLVRLDTPEVERQPELRRALAALWAELPNDSAKRSEKLLSWLDDPDVRVREQSSVALARSAGPSELAALAARLEQHAPYPVLTLQACAGALLRSAAALPAPLRERLLQQLKTYLEQPDEELAMSALFALRASRDPRAARWIAGLLRGSSLPLRAAALQALGDFDEQDARRLLRDTLRGDSVPSASSAALALAELGSDRDVDALLRAAERGSWPLQPSAAYAAARITQRAGTRKHSLERALCRFAQQRDSYVLANSISALATLGAQACDEQVEPQTLLAPSLPSALRVAAATWLDATHVPTAESCAADHDRAVAAACAPRHEALETTGLTLLRLFEPDGRTRLRGRTVALRLPNASVYIGRSDNAGLLLFPRALHGEMVLEDPADYGAVAITPRAALEAP